MQDLSPSSSHPKSPNDVVSISQQLETAEQTVGFLEQRLDTMEKQLLELQSRLDEVRAETETPVKNGS